LLSASLPQKRVLLYTKAALFFYEET